MVVVNQKVKMGLRPAKTPVGKLIQWLDNHYQGDLLIAKGLGQDNTWKFPTSFFFVALSPLALFWVGWSPVAVAVAVALYWVRMFGITGVYHRYFSHRTFKTSRWFQFVLAVIGNSSAQRGPLWWAAHHRHHHKFSDQPEDAHSPLQGGFWNSHIGWWGRNKNMPTQLDQIKDFAKYPELVFMDRFDSIVPLGLAGLCYALGAFLEAYAPQLGTTGLQMLAWGFGISTFVLFNGVAVINSLAHVIGKKRFDSGDDSRNSLPLAIITMGEGWHNNHHFYANSTRQGFYWWEWDPTYYLLWGMSKVGLVWDLKPVPDRVLKLGRAKSKGVADAEVRPVEPGARELLKESAEASSH
jgi:stearoyl-CoA desaturase (delta-9 desaturase)